MKVSVNWLKEYVSFDETKETLDTLFSLKSQEVEYTKKLAPASGLVVGYIKACNPHPNADKLSVCEVDVKTETLTIVCGASNVAANQHVIVAKDGAVLPNNFKITKTALRGIESNGMICSLSEIGIEQKYHNEEGIHVIKTPVEIGSDAIKALHFDDEIIALDLTPNRMDLLSMHGVAYDLAAILDKPLKIKEPTVNYAAKKNPMTITTNTKDCYSYYGSVIDDIVIKDSPQWMKARLIAAGIRPINNVVDITNYVMIETGQPLHAFDFEALNSTRIIVRNAKKNETFVTLDDKKRNLDLQDIVITNGEKAVALAGVMGGADTEVTPNTKSILLESAVFNPVSVRKTSSRLDLRSESSMRFERRVDVAKTRYALDRATELFIAYADASVRKDVVYFDNTDRTIKTIAIKLQTINHVLGSAYTLEDVKSILTRLRFTFKCQDETFIIDKPTRRPDFENYQDIIEEIGRIGGYDTLPNTLPDTISIGELSPIQIFRRRVRQTLNGLGLDEVITYNLVNPKTKHQFTLDKSLEAVTLKNPMSDKRAILRLTQLNGLMDVVSYNMARQMEHVHIFELGKRYTQKAETEVLSIAMSGSYHDKRWQTNTPTTFFTLKGIFDALLKRFDLPSAQYEKITIDNYHPHQTARIIFSGETIGHIGKVHPKTVDNYDLENVYLLEVDFSVLFKANQTIKNYQPINKYPSVSRDIAIVCDKDIPADTIISTINNTLDDTLTSVHIFDVYEGEHIAENQKSLGIRLVFSTISRTLKTHEVDVFIEHVLDALKTTHKATLR